MCTHEAVSPDGAVDGEDVEPADMEVEPNPGVDGGELSDVGDELAVSDGDGVGEGEL